MHLKLQKTIQNYICKTTNAKTIVIPKNLLLYKTLIASISNRKLNAPFNQKPCNPRAQQTGHLLCWPLLYHSQDRNLSL